VRLAFIALCLASLAIGCGGKSQFEGVEWVGDTHATSTGGDPGDRRIGVLTEAEARKGLAAALDAGDHLDAVIYANRLAAVGGEPTADQRELIAAAVDELRSDDLDTAWVELDADHYPASLVVMRLALVAQHRGDLERALEWLNSVKGDDLVGKRATELRERIEALAAVDPKVVAALLPLSGRHSALGVEIRGAIKMAKSSGGRGVKLVFVDTKGDADTVAEAVDKAVFEHNAVAIIGPVGVHESRAAARRAAELGIPIALLAPGEDAAAPEVGVFRLWVSSEWEAREAVRAAIDNSYDRLAVLAPRDEQGGAQAQAFIDAAVAEGVEVVAVGQYDPTATDLEPDLKEFLKLDPLVNERLRNHLRRKGRKKGWKTFSPDIPFDLLYIPDRYDRAALVASYLPFFNVEVRSDDMMNIPYLKKKHGGRVPQVVQLLGSSGWHHLSLIPRGGSAVDGAMVVDVFAGNDSEEFATEEGAHFGEAYRSAVGRYPTPVAAQAYDAGLMVFAARAEAETSGKGGDVRAAFAEALSKTKLDGVCGAATMVNGAVERQSILLRIDGDEFVLHEY
jgi:ABC-type branched-subunit amino acid transport system substrate-binding protein